MPARRSFPWHGRTRSPEPVESRLDSRRRPTPQTPPQFLFQSSRRRGPAAWQRANHQLIRLSEFAQNRAGHVSQSACDPVPLHGRADGLADNQADVWRGPAVAAVAAAEVHDDVGLRDANPVLHGRVKLN
jgi:hypothetical protein